MVSVDGGIESWSRKAEEEGEQEEATIIIFVYTFLILYGIKSAFDNICNAILLI